MIGNSNLYGEYDRVLVIYTKNPHGLVANILDYDVIISGFRTSVALIHSLSN